MTGKVWYPSPINNGVPKSANALMKTISVAAMIVGIHNGMTILKKRLKPEQPMFSEASSSELSIFFKAPDTYRKTNGNNCKAKTSRIPLKP